MPCTRCGSDYHDLSRCPWPRPDAKALLRLNAWWLVPWLAAWSLIEGWMLP